MIDYDDAYDELSDEEKVGHLFLTVFAQEVPLNSWSEVRSEAVYQAVSDALLWSNVKSMIEAKSLSEAQCLSGIDHWLEVRGEGERWARALCEKWIAASGIDELPTNHNYCDWAVMSESEENPGLWNIRANDPLLFGEICIEVERVCNLLVDESHSILH